MGLLAKILGIGPLFFGALIILVLFIATSIPALAPMAPYMAILLPALVLTLWGIRRRVPAAVSWMRKGVDSYVYWHVVCNDIPFSMAGKPGRNRVNDGELRKEEATIVFDDWGRNRGWAVKVLRVADVRKNFETTTEEERVILLDRMVKAIEGLGDVEAKLVIDRSPSGETAHIILYAAFEGGDEQGAKEAVEHSAVILSRQMEGIGIDLLDDVSYFGKGDVKRYISPDYRVRKPSRLHLPLLAATSAATLFTGALTPGLGAMGQVIAASGLLGLFLTYVSWNSVLRLTCSQCASGAVHQHWSIGNGSVYFGDGGTLVWKGKGETVVSRFASISGNNNRDLTGREIDKRLPAYLAIFNNLIYTLRDFRIALHITPQPVGDTVKLAMARADLYGMDAQVGGAVSGYLKAGRSMNVADRIMHGERPYVISGVIEVRARSSGDVTQTDLDILDKQLHEARSLLDSMNLSTKVVKDGWGAALCHRFLYLPPPARTALDPDPIPSVKALTRDFVAVSPLAFRRRPIMFKDGIYLGRDEFGRPVYWNPSKLHNPHMLVLGSPGTGKSTLIKTLIFRSGSLIPYTGTGRPPSFIIIDPAGEYADKADELRAQGIEVTVVDLCNMKYNPLLLSGLPPEQRISRFVDHVLPNVIPITPTQASILYQGLRAIFEHEKLGGIRFDDPSTWTDERAARCTIKMLYSYVAWRRSVQEQAVRQRGGSPEVDTGVSLLLDLERRLRPFAEGAFALDRTDVTVKDLVNRGGVVIISYRTSSGGGSVVMTDEMQRLITWSVLEHIHSYMLSQQAKEGVRLIVVIDEGHKFILGKQGEVPLGQHLREERKFGTSYILITHLLDDLLQEADMAKRRGVPTVAALVSTTIAFGYGNPGEAYNAQRLLNLTENERRRLEGFATGEAFLKWSIDPRPLYFRVEPEEKAMVRRRMSRREMYYEAL
jgi:hypothetical protein